jgi:hypothetical protein
MRAADDFDVIRARIAELRRERDRAVPRKDDDLNRHTRSVDVDERFRSVDIEDRTSQQKARVFYGRG